MGRVVLLCVGIIGILSVAESAAMLAGVRQPYRDPFFQYEAIMPGEPSAALEQYSCNFYRDETSTAHCTFALQGGRFDFVDIVYDHTITWISFTVHSDSLHLADLVQCWGKFSNTVPVNPQFRRAFAYVWWDDQKYATVVADRYSTHLNYFLPLYSVAIAGAQQPCRSRQ